MFTSIDKAAGAAILGVGSLLVQTGVIHLTPEQTTGLVAAVTALTPFLVWLVPNKNK